MKIKVRIATHEVKNKLKEICGELDGINGISKVSFNDKFEQLSFNYDSHNAMESVRIKLMELGCPIVFDPNVLK